MEHSDLHQPYPHDSASRLKGTSPEARLILIVSDGFASSLDVAAVVNVFGEADRLAKEPVYTIRIVSSLQNSFGSCSSNWTAVGCDNTPARVDTLIVADAVGTDRGSMQSDFRHWLQHQCSVSRRTVAIGGGTFTLAAAGLLDGRRAVTHWALHEQLKQSFPRVLLKANVLYTNDHNLYTCAGAVASVDLALRLVEDDLSSDIAAQVASRMLLHFRRTGDSNQVSLTLQAQAASSDPISRLVGWLPDHLSKELSVRTLARRVAMSPRNFARVFRQQVGVTPAKYVESLRLEAAQRELRNVRQTVGKAAELSGFSNTETLRRIFLRRLGETPAVFRRRIT